MRLSTAFSLALATQSYALGPLSEIVKDIPSCSHAALASAMAKKGCVITDISSGTFDCLCGHHMVPILLSVQQPDMSPDCCRGESLILKLPSPLATTIYWGFPRVSFGTVG